MTNGWIVMKKGYEYDDVIYSSVGGGSPVKILASKEAAEQEAARCVFNTFEEGLNFNDYGHGTEELAADWIRDYSHLIEEWNKLVPEKYQVSEDSKCHSFKVGPGIAREQSDNLTKLFPRLNLFYVIEMTID